MLSADLQHPKCYQLLAIIILIPTQGLRCLVRKQPNNPSSVFSGFYFESLSCVCTKTNIGYTCICIYLLFHIFSKAGDWKNILHSFHSRYLRTRTDVKMHATNPQSSDNLPSRFWCLLLQHLLLWWTWGHSTGIQNAHHTGSQQLPKQTPGKSLGFFLVRDIKKNTIFNRKVSHKFRKTFFIYVEFQSFAATTNFCSPVLSLHPAS